MGKKKQEKDAPSKQDKVAKKAAKKAAKAEAPATEDLKQHVADVLKIPVDQVLAARQRPEGLVGVTAHGQKVLLNEDGIEFLCGPEKVSKKAIRAAAIVLTEEEPDELPALEEDEADDPAGEADGAPGDNE